MNSLMWRSEIRLFTSVLGERCSHMWIGDRLWQSSLHTEKNFQSYTDWKSAHTTTQASSIMQTGMWHIQYCTTSLAGNMVTPLTHAATDRPQMASLFTELIIANASMEFITEIIRKELRLKDSIPGRGTSPQNLNFRREKSKPPWKWQALITKKQIVKEVVVTLAMRTVHFLIMVKEELMSDFEDYIYQLKICFTSCYYTSFSW